MLTSRNSEGATTSRVEHGDSGRQAICAADESAASSRDSFQKPDLKAFGGSPSKENALDRVFDGLCRVSDFIAVCLMTLMAGFVMLSAVMRYLFGSPFHFTEDLVGLLFCSIVFLVLPGVQLRNRHIKVDLLATRFSSKIQKLQLLATHALTVLFGTLFVREAYSFLAYTYERHSITLIGDIPLYPWIAIVVFGVAATTLLAVRQMVRLRHGQAEAQRPTKEVKP